MIRTASGATAAAAISLAVFGQTAGRRPPESPSFEAASVKPAAPSSQRGARVEENPETIILRNTTLKNALARAFGLKFGNQISGPSWILTERYDIVAKAPHNTSAEQMPRMLQALLVERFMLVLHHESRTLAAYALIAGKGHINMQPAADGASRENSLVFVNGHREAKRMSMAGLARLPSLILNTPVVDMTALSSFYNFPFELSFEERGGMNADQAVPGGEPKSNGSRSGNAEPLTSPSVFTLVENLGLKLESRHMPFDVIVIDSGNKVPTEN